MIIFSNKVFKILFNIVKILVFLLIFLYIAFIFVQRISNNKSVAGYRVYTIATNSMKGVYDVNDVILVKDCDTSKLKVGDDIVYMGNKHDLNGKIISHRIIEIKKDKDTGDIKFVTKGVANEIEDPAITPDQVLGKVEGVLPFISPINHIIKSQVGFFLLIFCPLVIVIVLQILQIISDMGEDKQKLDRIGQTTIAMERIMCEERKEDEDEDQVPVIERVTEESKEKDDNKDEEEIEELDIDEEKNTDKDKDEEKKFVINNEVDD